jgi:hypothetical protein
LLKSQPTAEVQIPSSRLFSRESPSTYSSKGFLVWIPAFFALRD